MKTSELCASSPDIVVCRPLPQLINLACHKSPQEEGVGHIEALTPGSFAAELRDTLLCFVLVGPAFAHAFCSRYDFGPWPLLPGVAALPPAVLQVTSHYLPST